MAQKFLNVLGQFRLGPIDVVCGVLLCGVWCGVGCGVSVWCVGGVCVHDFRGCVQDLGAHPDLPPPDPRPPDRPKFRAVFPSPATICILPSLSWEVFSLNFGGVFEGGTLKQMCTFGLSGCRVKPWRSLFSRTGLLPLWLHPHQFSQVGESQPLLAAHFACAIPSAAAFQSLRTTFSVPTPQLVPPPPLRNRRLIGMAAASPPPSHFAHPSPTPVLPPRLGLTPRRTVFGHLPCLHLPLLSGFAPVVAARFLCPHSGILRLSLSQSQVSSPPPLCSSAHPSCCSLSPCSATPHVPCVRLLFSTQLFGGLLLHPPPVGVSTTLSPSCAALPTS